MPEIIKHDLFFFKLFNYQSTHRWLRYVAFFLSFLKYSAILFILFLCWCTCFFLFSEALPFIKNETDLNPGPKTSSAFVNHFWAWISLYGWGPNPQIAISILIPSFSFSFLVIRLLEQSICFYGKEKQLSILQKVFYQNDFLKSQQSLLNHTGKISDVDKLIEKTGELFLLYTSKIQPTIIAIILFTTAGLIANTSLFLIFSGLFFLILAIQTILANKINLFLQEQKKSSTIESEWFLKLYNVMSFSKAFGLSHIWLEKLSLASNKHLNTKLRINLYINLEQHLGYFCFILCLGIYLLLSEIFITLKVTSTPDLFISGSTAFFTAFYSKLLINCKNIMIENFPATTELFKKMEDKSGFTQHHEGSLAFPIFKTIHLDAISIKNCFNSPLINDLTLHIDKNSRIGFAGLQKEQRTALGLLLSCALTPDMGEIRFDNINARSLNTNLIPKEITFVPELFQIMPDTFQNIICNYSQNPDWPRMLESAKSTNIHAAILTQPDSYNFFYDPENNSFDSVFQFLLGLTRSVYLDAKTLILEEPHNLDSTQNQDIINAVYEKTLGGKTIIFLQGSEATLSTCDKIYFFQNKRVISSGTHKALSQDYPGYHLINNL